MSNKFVQKEALAVKVGMVNKDIIATTKSSFFILYLLYTFKILQAYATQRLRRPRIQVPRFVKAAKETLEQRVVPMEK